MVVFSHAFTTTGTHEPQPIHFGHSLGVTWGHIGVAIFFTTSGYLVAQSWRPPTRGPLVPGQAGHAHLAGLRGHHRA